MNHRVFLVPTLACIAGLSAAESVPEPAADAITVQAEVEAPPATGTKTETPPLLQPQTISTVDSDVMRDQQVLKLEDAIRNVAGVTIGGYYGEWDYFRIRGFDAGDNTRQDGLFASPGYWLSPDMAGVEKVEVLKGPSAMLYGRSALGGMVNLVSKQPERKPSTTVSLSGGSYDFGEIMGDTGATFADGAAGVRLVAMGRTYGSFTDGVEDSRRLYVAPSFTWWGEDTTLTVLSHYQRDLLNAGWPLPASGFITANPNGSLPRDLNVGEPGFQNTVDNTRMAIGYQLEHRFTDDLSLRQNARYTRLNETFQGIYPLALQADDQTLDRTVYNADSWAKSVQVDTMLDARFATGSVRHEGLLGIDFGREQTTGRYGYASIASLDIFDPVYGAAPGPFTDYYDGETTIRQVGAYLQDQATVAEVLTITAGVRFDRVDAEEIEALAATATESHDTGTTWRVGLAWAFRPEASVYTSYATSFRPQPYNQSADGEQVDPERGDQVEAGLRLADLEGRYSANLAVYQITRRDVATADLANPGFSVITGEQRSRGFELETKLKPVDGLSFTGSYSYIRAVVSKDNSLPVGDRLLNVPDHSANGWAKYVLQEGALQGFGAGLGVQWYSSQAGDLPNTFELPAYAVIDAGLFYDRGPLSAQLNVDNLFDKTYAIGSYNDLYVRPGDPLTVRGTVSYTF